MLLVVLVIWTNLKLKQQRYPAQETCEIGENSTTRCVECKFDICLYHIMLLDARPTNAFEKLVLWKEVESNLDNACC